MTPTAAPTAVRIRAGLAARRQSGSQVAQKSTSAGPSMNASVQGASATRATDLVTNGRREVSPCPGRCWTTR